MADAPCVDRIIQPVSSCRTRAYPDPAARQTPTASSKLGAKGAGEAGTAGAPAAVMNAINDALAPFGTHVFSQPITPQKVLRALGKVS